MKGENALLVLGGSPPSDELLFWRHEEADLSVAVDAGFLAFRNAGICPDLLIGDMDSSGFGEELASEYPGLRVIRLPDQDSTDFEKALGWLNRETVTRDLIILGGLGGRSDHFLSNLMASCQVDPAVKLTFDGNEEWIGRVTPKCPLQLAGRAGSTLSLLALLPCEGVATSGLRCELNGSLLSPEGKVSQSNEAVSDQVTISCESGNLFVILQK